MIALDTNIILHILVKSQKEHGKAAAWISKTREPFATTGTNIAEVLRLLTHPRVFPKPLSLDQAIDLFQYFQHQFDIRILEESEHWWQELKELLEEIPDLRGNEVFDARIAICLRYHGIRDLCTLDGDFLKYPFLNMIKI